MAEDITLTMKLKLFPPMYNSVVLTKNPRVFYMAMQKQTYSFLTYDLQAFYVRDVILGKAKLPSKE